MKALRIFYGKEGSVVWTHGLEGEGDWPYDATIQDGDTQVIETTDSATITGFMASDTNKVIDGKLVIGEPRKPVEPVPQRNLYAEVDTLKAKVAALEAAKGVV